MSKSTFDLHQTITNQIIESLEAGVKDVGCPWQRMGSHRNGVSGKSYRGINVLLAALSATKNGFTGRDWFTYKQATDFGGHVRKGEKSTMMVAYRKVCKDFAGKSLPASVPEDDPRVKDSVMFIKYNRMFNADQLDNMPETVEPTGLVDTRNELGDAIFKSSGATIKIGGDMAYYNNSTEGITLPSTSLFKGDDALDKFWCVAFHELTHWTGAPARLDRPKGGAFGSPEYALEELVAELGSAFLCAHAGFNASVHHVDYIDNWLKALKGDKKFVFKAATAAQQAVDFLLDKTKAAELAA